MGEFRFYDSSRTGWGRVVINGVLWVLDPDRTYADVLNGPICECIEHTFVVVGDRAEILGPSWHI